MKKRLFKLTAIIFSLSLFFVLFFTSIESVVYNLPYYKWHYINRHIYQATGMSIDDLMFVTGNMVEYLENKRDTLDMQANINGRVEEVFGSREKAHMVDVKNLAVGVHNIRNICLIFAFILMAIAIIKSRRLLIVMLASIKYVFIFMSAFIAILGVLLVSNFDKYFTIFHHIFFHNNLWLLDPNTDILINMVPEIFFFTTAMLVIIVFALFTLLTILIAEVIKRKLFKKIG